VGERDEGREGWGRGKEGKMRRGQGGEIRRVGGERVEGKEWRETGGWGAGGGVGSRAS